MAERQAYTLMVPGSSPGSPTMIKKKKTIDKVLVLGDSPLNDDWWSEEKDEDLVEGVDGLTDEGETMMISGEMGVGSDKHPVTIKIVDEITGMEMEMSHVKNALLVVEDERRSTSGWLSMVIGDVNRVGEVLRFIAKATVEELRKIGGRKRSVD